MRAVEDDHVDRPGVQARQRVELTGTNRPTGLIALMIRVRIKTEHPHDPRPCDSPDAVRLLAEQTQTCAAPAWWPERCAQDPIPSRTRPSNAPAPMVLCLKTRESRSPPGLPSTRHPTFPHTHDQRLGAGWSSPVARQAHNLKVAGSNPAPATNINARDR